MPSETESCMIVDCLSDDGCWFMLEPMAYQYFIERDDHLRIYSQKIGAPGFEVSYSGRGISVSFADIGEIRIENRIGEEIYRL